MQLSKISKKFVENFHKKFLIKSLREFSFVKSSAIEISDYLRFHEPYDKRFIVKEI